jgi:hypothetical protein
MAALVVALANQTVRLASAPAAAVMQQKDPRWLGGMVQLSATMVLMS